MEETIKSFRKEAIRHELSLAANELFEDYMHDAELTAFTSLDFENFYETK